MHFLHNIRLFVVEHEFYVSIFSNVLFKPGSEQNLYLKIFGYHTKINITFNYY